MTTAGPTQEAEAAAAEAGWCAQTILVGQGGCGNVETASVISGEYSMNKPRLNCQRGITQTVKCLEHGARGGAFECNCAEQVPKVAPEVQRAASWAGHSKSRAMTAAVLQLQQIDELHRYFLPSSRSQAFIFSSHPPPSSSPIPTPSKWLLLCDCPALSALPPLCGPRPSMASAATPLARPRYAPSLASEQRPNADRLNCSP